MENGGDSSPVPKTEFHVEQLPTKGAVLSAHVIELDVNYDMLKHFPEISQQSGPNADGSGDAPRSSQFIMSEPYWLVGPPEKHSQWQLAINPNFRDGGERYISALMSMKDSKDNVDFVDVVYSIKLETNDVRNDYRKESRIRRFTKENPLFGWDKFLLFDKLGDNPPATIRFSASIQILGPEFDSESCAKYNEILFPKHGEDYKIPHKNCRDMDTVQITDNSNANANGNESGNVKKEFEMTESSRKKNLRRLWNYGKPKFTNALLICKDTKFPIHSEILSAKSETIAAHFLNQEDHFNLTPYMTDEIDPEIMQILLTYVYTDVKDLKTTAAKDGSLAGLRYLRLLKLWNATMLLKMRELEKPICDRVMSGVRKDSFLFLFSKYRQRVMALEGNRDPTKIEFIGYLKELRKTDPSVMSDYAANRYEYACVIFQE